MLAHTCSAAAGGPAARQAVLHSLTFGVRMLQVTKQLSKKKLERRASLKVIQSQLITRKVRQRSVVGEEGGGGESSMRPRPRQGGKSGIVPQACNREQSHSYRAAPHEAWSASQQHCLDAALQQLAWELQLVTAGATLMLKFTAPWERFLCAGR